ncbi:beta-1,4-mannosyl-glycoprotein 4-beta-N-acetylglucosaminyltransferase isoform 3-T3 [Mantella aurantiaca]
MIKEISSLSFRRRSNVSYMIHRVELGKYCERVLNVLRLRMKMRWHKMFLLLCMAGLCVISVLHFLKALSYVSLSRELVSLSPNLISGFFWESRPLLLQHVERMDDGAQVLRTPGYYRPPQLSVQQPKPPPSSHGESLNIDDMHIKDFLLQEDTAEYFVRTKSGGVCFKPGTKSLDRPLSEKPEKISPRKSSSGISRQQQQQSQKRRKWVECVCLPGWHGPSCGVPTVVQHSNLPTKDRLIPRLKPRRVINAININHEFDLLEARFHELEGAVDVFLICESNFTAYGESRSLLFRQMLLNGTFDYVKSKVLYVFLDHFPEGGKQDGWIADDYLRTFLTRNGISRLQNLRDDDLFIIDDADEIPSKEGLVVI